MIITATHDQQWKHASSPADVDALINTVLLEGSSDEPSWIFADDKPITADTIDLPEIFCRVATNPTSGYAALLWFLNVDPADHPEDPRAQEIWVSFNASPPLEDPRLASDIDTQRYHDRFTAIPISHARTGLHDFCRTGGDRIPMITWVAGDYYGRITERIAIAA